MLVAVALLTVFVVVMLVAMALLTVFVVVMVMMLFLKLPNSFVKSVLSLNSRKDISAREVVPRGSYDGGTRIMLSEQSESLVKLMLLDIIGVGKNYGRCRCNLVVVKLAKVLHIHLALSCVCNRGEAIEHRAVGIYTLYRADNVRKLTDARRLYYDSVRVKLVKHLDKRL